MIYGTLTKAKEFDAAGEIDRWLQLFLRGDGKNIALADGLLLEERYYLGPVLWTMAGNLDKLNHAYSSRFFSRICCLALVCDEELLRSRMHEGRGITDDGWIQSSVEYNQYFKSHERLGDTKFEIFDISGKSVVQVADYVVEWVESFLE